MLRIILLTALYCQKAHKIPGAVAKPPLFLLLSLTGSDSEGGAGGLF